MYTNYDSSSLTASECCEIECQTKRKDKRQERVRKNTKI